MAKMNSYRCIETDQNAWWKPVITDWQPPAVGEMIFIYCDLKENETDNGDGYGYLVQTTKVTELIDGGWLVYHDMRPRHIDW